MNTANELLLTLIVLFFCHSFLTETPKQKSGNKRLDRPAENLNVGHKHHDGCKTKLACLSAIVESRLNTSKTVEEDTSKTLSLKPL